MVSKKTQTKARRISLARAHKLLTPTEMFFFEHSGWSYDPAKESAQARRQREAQGMVFRYRGL